MVLLDWLYAVGDKLKIIQVTSVTQAPESPRKISTRTVLLKDLVTEIQSEEVRSLAQQPEEVFDGFDRIFEAAGIKPSEHGWTVERLRDLLRQGPYRTMDLQAAQQALVQHLLAAKVPIEDLIKDAVARDKALDAFEETAREKMREREESRKRRTAELQAQIETLRKQCADLEQQGQAELSQWRQWHSRKVDFEKEMAWAIGYLMDKPVVTVDNDGP